MKYLLFILLFVVLPLEIIACIISFGFYPYKSKYFTHDVINLIKEFK